MKKITGTIIIGFVLTTLCFAQSGEINRGIFVQEGIASWYGKEFNGRSTASGEIFNDAAFTAAHPTLPFGTMLKVTNQHNNKSVTVRVNDRGPFVAARIIDLSRAAAQELDMIATGTAPVKVESLSEVGLFVKPAPQPAVAAPRVITNPPSVTNSSGVTNPPSVINPPGVANPPRVTNPSGIANPPVVTSPSVVTSVKPSATVSDSYRVLFHPAIPEVYTGKNYRIQVGAYKEIRYAEEAYIKLKNVGLNPEFERYGDFYRVVLPGLKQEELSSVSERLGRAGFSEAMLREEVR
jgi:rare lipoprotein A